VVGWGESTFGVYLLMKTTRPRDTGTLDPAGIPYSFYVSMKNKNPTRLVHMVNLYILYVTWNVATTFSFVRYINCFLI
jgi:hypothetical protein